MKKSIEQKKYELASSLVQFEISINSYTNTLEKFKSKEGSLIGRYAGYCRVQLEYCKRQHEKVSGQLNRLLIKERKLIASEMVDTTSKGNIKRL